MKYLFTFLIFSSALFIACGSDDDNTDDTASIVGTWKFSSFTINGQPGTLEACENLATVIFTANNAFSDEYFFGTDCSESETSNGTYELNGNILTVNFSGGTPSSVTIETLNNTTLSFSETDEGDLYIDTYTRQ